MTDVMAWGDRLRRKWSTVPTGSGRRDSSDLLQLDDSQLIEFWRSVRDSSTIGSGFQERGWYHELYREFLKGKKILDIGCGFGISTVCFAELGARVTFVDIVEPNVRLVQRLCRILGLNAEFAVMNDANDLKRLPYDFDVIAAIGSLHNAPFEFMREEVAEIIPHLKEGGRWLQFAYPFSRWCREGAPPFDKWGEMTDGEGTPWCEPYDLEKLYRLLSPAQLETIFYYEWHNSDFNWFDLKLVSHSRSSGGMTESPFSRTCNEIDALRLEHCDEQRRELYKAENAKNRLEVAELRQQNMMLCRREEELGAILKAIEHSAGWRVLNAWRRARESLIPPGSHRRKLYDRFLRSLCG